MANLVESLIRLALLLHLPRVLLVIVATVICDRTFQIVACTLFFTFWIAGIIYCERVGDERQYSPWIARLAGALLPIVGPAIFWFLRRRGREKGERLMHWITR